MEKLGRNMPGTPLRVILFHAASISGLGMPRYIEGNLTLPLKKTVSYFTASRAGAENNIMTAVLYENLMKDIQYVDSCEAQFWSLGSEVKALRMSQVIYINKAKPWKIHM